MPDINLLRSHDSASLGGHGNPLIAGLENAEPDILLFHLIKVAENTPLTGETMPYFKAILDLTRKKYAKKDVNYIRGNIFMQCWDIPNGVEDTIRLCGDVKFPGSINILARQELIEFIGELLDRAQPAKRGVLRRAWDHIATRLAKEGSRVSIRLGNRPNDLTMT
jgi:hypothetical protein